MVPHLRKEPVFNDDAHANGGRVAVSEGGTGFLWRCSCPWRPCGRLHGQTGTGTEIRDKDWEPKRTRNRHQRTKRSGACLRTPRFGNSPAVPGGTRGSSRIGCAGQLACPGTDAEKRPEVPQARRPSPRRVSLGRTISTSKPPPEAREARIEPPCRSTARLAMARPRPTPPLRRSRAASLR